jgi:hypothetical protein
MRYMLALPEDAREQGPARLTGVTCPECPGVLTVEAEDRDALVFECRIGHSFSSDELIADKEKQAERLLWAAVEALEELGALLWDLGVDGERAKRAQEEAVAVRRLIDATVLAKLDEVAGCRDGAGEG